MKVTNYKKQGDVVKFNVSGVNVRMLNALRRVIISGMPTMAIEKVTFYNNSSVLNDELLAHRLGLIPLKTDLKTYNMLAECTCKGKGCGKCTATLTLEAEGPKTVHSGELKSTDPKITPVYDKIPIVKLTGKQKVRLEATAQLGLGGDHIKWQPAIAAYEQLDKDSYEFMVESFGQHDPEELLSQAFGIIEAKLKDLKKQVD